MKERRNTGAQPQPKAAELLLHYANAKPTERTWRGIVLGPGVVLDDGRAADLTPFGETSLGKVSATLEDLRSVLSRIVSLESPYAEDAQTLAREITAKAAPKFMGWKFSPIDEKFFELWDTENTSFKELVFFTLAQVLKEVPFLDLHRCEACENFFVGASRRDRKFCSNACRSRITVRKYRELRAQGAAPRATRTIRTQSAAPTTKGKRRS